MSGRDNIILTGFMGTGKSTVGALVARELDRRFVDMDDVIVERAGKSIPQIFRDGGEAAFRALERQLAEELSEASRLVIATGGGALLRDDLRRLMGKSGALICLSASKCDIRQRLADPEGRPLAGDWEALLDARQSAYAKIKIQIDTSGKSPEAVAGEVIARCQGRLHVRTPAGPGYDIWVQPGLLRQIDQFAHALGLDGQVFVVTNETVAPLYGRDLVGRLPHASLITLPDGEARKTLATVAGIYDELLKLGADRSATLIALGGGVIGDMAGYAAATYMRGIPLIQIPTTLLAMVDASVGGKVGVDLPQGKNLIGAFKQPRAVLIDTETLRSLPPMQWRCGMAEVIKHGLIARPSLLDPDRWQPEGAVDLVREAVQVKIDVVEADPYERGIRAHLNLGHTFGHAIERLTDYRLPHGEAVAIGIVRAARLSHNLGMIERDLVDEIVALLRRAGLPVDIKLDPEQWYAAMSTDKKWRSGKSRFVLLEALGRAAIVEGLPKADVLAVL